MSPESRSSQCLVWCLVPSRHEYTFVKDGPGSILDWLCELEQIPEPLCLWCSHL